MQGDNYKRITYTLEIARRMALENKGHSFFMKLNLHYYLIDIEHFIKIKFH